jgi:hypothetical protein
MFHLLNIIHAHFSMSVISNVDVGDGVVPYILPFLDCRFVQLYTTYYIPEVPTSRKLKNVYIPNIPIEI